MPETDALIALSRALTYRERMSHTAPGTELAALRAVIMQQGADLDRATGARDRLVAIRLADMPPATDDLALLLDTLAFRIGAHSRADAWRAIGISPNRGRDLLARNAHGVDWPVWRTMRLYALEDGFGRE